MVVTPLLRERFLGHGPSDRARVYRPAKRRKHHPRNSTFSHRPNGMRCRMGPRNSSLTCARDALIFILEWSSVCEPFGQLKEKAGVAL